MKQPSKRMPVAMTVDMMMKAISPATRFCSVFVQYPLVKEWNEADIGGVRMEVVAVFRETNLCSSGCPYKIDHCLFQTFVSFLLFLSRLYSSPYFQVVLF